MVFQKGVGNVGLLFQDLQWFSMQSLEVRGVLINAIRVALLWAMGSTVDSSLSVLGWVGCSQVCFSFPVARECHISQLLEHFL